MLDQEGEYYFDEPSGYLYFMPPGGKLEEEGVMISINATVVNLTNVADVVLRDMDVMYAKSIAVSASNVSRLVISNVSVGNTGGVGMSVSDGRDTLVEGCHIYGIGCSAMSISGGNRTALTAGNITVRDNVIHDWALVSRSYEAGIAFGGCGNRVTGNELFNAPHTAITGSGNNYYFAENTVHDVCRGTADAGAFYVGRTWGSLGNTLERNNFSRVGNVEEMAQHTQTAAVYLDDGDSGWVIRDNYLGTSDYCILMGVSWSDFMITLDRSYLLLNVLLKMNKVSYDRWWAEQHGSSQLLRPVRAWDRHRGAQRAHVQQPGQRELHARPRPGGGPAWRDCERPAHRRPRLAVGQSLRPRFRAAVQLDLLVGRAGLRPRFRQHLLRVQTGDGRGGDGQGLRGAHRPRGAQHGSDHRAAQADDHEQHGALPTARAAEDRRRRSRSHLARH